MIRICVWGVFLALFLCRTFSAQAQLSTLHTKYFKATADTILLDTVSMVPETFTLEAYSGDSAFMLLPKHYFLDESSSKFRLKKIGGIDSLQATYRVFPFYLNRVFYNKEYEKFATSDPLLKPIEYYPSADQPDFWDFDGIDYNGSFSRGISFGNRQDVVVNSTFNLQMSGKLREGVEINAVITDNNVPVQPEGNTQQLQEFDRVFIELKKDEQRLIVGDFELRRPESYFMLFQRNLQGASYKGAFDFINYGKLKTGISAAVARGQYVRRPLPVEEGNQGPYQITGANGERFIIVLAGSERVFYDGELLVRGTENDYVIDYNAGEITFTVNKLITKDKRVFIEYEYADRKYLRSLIHLNSEWASDNEKLKLNFNMFTEQDAKNQPIETLTNEEKDILRASGDSLSNTFAPGFEKIPFEGERIMYRLTDSLGFDTVFVYSSDSSLAEYVLSFSFLGAGKGNYIVSPSTANGRVYRWVAPIDNIPQGQYEPVRILTAPTQQQLFTLGASYSLSNSGQVKAEVALSNRDLNTYSEIGNEDDKGIAIYTEYGQDFKLGKDDENAPVFRIKTGYEFKDQRFQPLERYRSAEFERDWNLPLSPELRDEHLMFGDLELGDGDKYTVGYRFTSFLRPGDYSGFINEMRLKGKKKGLLVNFKGNFLKTSSDSINSRFLRPRLDISQSISPNSSWRLGFNALIEDNHFREGSDDSLSISSFYNHELKVYIRNADTSDLKFYAEYMRRMDKLPDGGVLRRANYGDLFNVNGEYSKGPSQQLRWNLSLRNLNVTDTVLSKLNDELSLLGRFEYGLSIKKGLLRTDLLYELGSGQEPGREISYLRVPAGEGIYAWIDYNENEVQELNEFELANFTDQAEYIRIFVPGAEFIRANINQFNVVAGFNPAVLLRNKKGFAGFLARFANQWSWQLNRKVLENAAVSPFNPFVIDVADSSLVSLSSLLRNTVYINRNKSGFGLTYTWQQNRNKQLIANGTESRSIRDHELKARWNISKSFDAGLRFLNRQKSLISLAFDGRDYDITQYDLEPSISFLYNNSFRASLSYKFRAADNDPGEERARNHEGKLELRYNVVAKSTFNTSFSYVKVDYNALNDTPLAYAMLEGLQGGSNFLWLFSFERRISKVVQLSLSYEGRKTGAAAVSHIGRAQLRAIF